MNKLLVVLLTVLVFGCASKGNRMSVDRPICCNPPIYDCFSLSIRDRSGRNYLPTWPNCRCGYRAAAQLGYSVREDPTLQSCGYRILIDRAKRCSKSDPLCEKYSRAIKTLPKTVDSDDSSN